MKRLCLVMTLLLTVVVVGLGFQTSEKKQESKKSMAEPKGPKAVGPQKVVIDITADSDGDPQAADKKLRRGDSATWNNQYGADCRVIFDPFKGPTKVGKTEKSPPLSISNHTPYGTYTYVLDCDPPKGGGVKGADPAIIVTP